MVSLAHRHAPEIEQGLSAAAGRPLVVNFTPHLIPMNRGICRRSMSAWRRARHWAIRVPCSKGPIATSGVVTVTSDIRIVSWNWSVSRRCKRSLTLRGCFGSEVS